MTTDKLTDEELARIRRLVTEGWNAQNDTVGKLLAEVDRLRAGLNRAKELREYWAQVGLGELYTARIEAADEILKGFEP